ncbi:MAG: hypothetical protein ACR2HY_08490 [Acidimicrobiales bacterium]
MTRQGEHLQIGPVSRSRELAGAAVLAAGAAIVIATTTAGFKLYQNVAVLGAVVTLAWLVDGTSRRYVGAGLAALAVGAGLTIGQDVGVQNYEHSLVYALLGATLLAISWISPKAIRGSGTFLVLVASTVVTLTWVASYNGGWEIAAGLGLWSLLEFARLAKSASPQVPVGSPAAAPGRADDSAREPTPQPAGRH